MSRSVLHALCILSGLSLLALPAAGQSSSRATGGVFERVGGSWSGGGMVTVAGGDPERMRCRAYFSPAGAAQLHLELRCASDSFKLQVSSDITRMGERIAGNWSEASSGASGSLSGSAGANQLDAMVTGAGTSARLTLAVRGDVQAITLATRGTIDASASISLRRS